MGVAKGLDRPRRTIILWGDREPVGPRRPVSSERAAAGTAALLLFGLDFRELAVPTRPSLREGILHSTRMPHGVKTKSVAREKNCRDVLTAAPKMRQTNMKRGSRWRKSTTRIPLRVPLRVIGARRTAAPTTRVWDFR